MHKLKEVNEKFIVRKYFFEGYLRTYCIFKNYVEIIFFVFYIRFIPVNLVAFQLFLLYLRRSDRMKRMVEKSK